MRYAALLFSVALVAGCGSAATRVSPSVSAQPAEPAKPKAEPSTSLAPSPKPSATTATTIATTDEGVVSPIITGTEPIVEGSPLPPVPTIDLHTGNIVRLDWLLPGKKPVLVWFWAPH
jgi:hypothetical protein